MITWLNRKRHPKVTDDMAAESRAFFFRGSRPWGHPIRISLQFY